MKKVLLAIGLVVAILALGYVLYVIDEIIYIIHTIVNG